MPIIHYHIFKNAGTSVDRALEEAFGTRWGTFEGSTAVDVLSSEDVSNFLSAHPDIEALSTHLGRPPVPPGFLPILFFRHPIERSAAIHRFLSKARHPFHENAPDLSFPEWVDWALDSPAGVVVRNYQTVHLSSASFAPGGILNAVATETELGEAIETIATWRFIGLVSEFSRSIDRFNECYRESLQGKRLNAARLNVTREDSTSEDARVEEIRRELGSSRYRRLVDANELDSRLYASVKARFFS